MRQARWQRPRRPRPISGSPRPCPWRARAARRHRRLRRHRRGLRPRPRRPRRARPRRGRRQAAAPVLDLGDHPLPDPGRARAFPPRAAPEPRPAAGPDRDRGRRQVVHPRRGAAPARPLRRRGLQGQGLPPLPARGAARQDRRGGELQGRRRQDLDRGAPRHVGGARRLPGAGRRPRQPGLDDLDLRPPGRRRVGHGVSRCSPATTPSAAAREPRPRRARARRRCRSTRRCSRR